MLRPRDIKNQKFRSAIKGYRMEDVDKFLEKVYFDYQALYVENLRLYEENDELKIKIEDYAAKESYFDEAKKMALEVVDATNKYVKKKYDDAQGKVRSLLDKAQTDARTIREGAYDDGNAIIKNAEKEAFEKADKIINDAKEETAVINEQNEELFRKYVRMKKRIMLLIEAEAKIMNQADTYVLKNDEE